MAGSSVSRASLRAAGMPRVRQVSEAPLSDAWGNGCRTILPVPAQAGASGGSGTSGGEPERIRTVRRLYVGNGPGRYGQ